MNKIRKGDEVIVIAGKDKGRKGTVTTVFADDKVLVESINVAKKHVKPNPNLGVAGGIEEKEMPIQVSNVAIFNSATGKGDRVGFRVGDDGKKVRVFKSNGEQID